MASEFLARALGWGTAGTQIKYRVQLPHGMNVIFLVAIRMYCACITTNLSMKRCGIPMVGRCLGCDVLPIKRDIISSHVHTASLLEWPTRQLTVCCQQT